MLHLAVCWIFLAGLTPLETIVSPFSYVAFLTGLTIFLYIFLKRLLNRGIDRKKADCERLNNEYNKAVRENLKLKKDNGILKESAEEIIALYDITNDIRRVLDEDEIFRRFKDELSKYIKAGEVLFLKANDDLLQYKDYKVLPLVIENDTIGYLAARDVKEEFEDKFHILAQQFLAGLRGAILFKRVQGLTITDSLTGVFNRRYFLERFNEELGRSKKFKLKLSFLMVDIDNFKGFNDNYGHLAGDAILREITKIIKENIRQIDFMGRYGGEELSIILVETEKDKARIVCERIRQAVEARRIKVYDEELKVTISIGIAAFPDDGDETLALIEKADHALYKAKQTGRNRVCVYEAGV